MRKADLALVILAVVALVLTGIAIARSEAWTGERDYTATTVFAAAPGLQQTPTGTAGTRIDWEAPDNAVGVSAEFAITFQGQAVQGGQAIVHVRGTAPDGTALPTLTQPMPIGAAASSGSLTVHYSAAWDEVPGKVRDNRHPPALDWEQPLSIVVSVDAPSGDVALATYAFTVAATGTFAAFTLA